MSNSFRCGFHRFNDLFVAGTTAQISGKGFFDLFSVRVWNGIQKGFCGHEHPGSAKPALNRAVMFKFLLKGMRAVNPFKTLHGGNLLSVGANRRNQTGIYGFSIHQDRTRSALTGGASPLDPFQA